MNTLRMYQFETPLGEMVAGAICDGADERICLLEFEGRRALPTERRFLEKRFASVWELVDSPTGVLADLVEELRGYFAGTLRDFSIPLLAPGTPFREQVWRELQNIPYGQTISYIELARRVGKPKGPRAVGQANGCNRIAVVIPCHRVIAADGTLGGYGGRLWRKERLLNLEQGIPMPEAPMSEFALA